MGPDKYALLVFAVHTVATWKRLAKGLFYGAVEVVVIARWAGSYKSN